MTTRLSTAFRAVWPPLVLGVLLLALWQAVVRGFDFKPYFLVAPTDILTQFTDNWSNIWSAMQVTGTNAAYGILFGVIFGVVLSFLLSRWKMLDEIITPMSIAVNSVPAFVLVPVFNNMFGTTSVVPRRLMVTIVVFFIVLVNVSKGLRQVQPVHAELMRSYAAGGWTVLRKVRVPNAVPYLFTALRVSAPLAVIYAYVAEYVGGAQTGLGSRITSNIANSKNAAAWAYVFGACLLGLTFYLLATMLESVATPGGRSNRSREGS